MGCARRLRTESAERVAGFEDWIGGRSIEGGRLMEAKLDSAIDQVFRELVADTHNRDAGIANAAHSCIATILDWKRRRLLEEEIRQAEILRERHRL